MLKLQTLTILFILILSHLSCNQTAGNDPNSGKCIFEGDLIIHVDMTDLSNSHIITISTETKVLYSCYSRVLIKHIPVPWEYIGNDPTLIIIPEDSSSGSKWRYRTLESGGNADINNSFKKDFLFRIPISHIDTINNKLNYDFLGLEFVTKWDSVYDKNQNIMLSRERYNSLYPDDILQQCTNYAQYWF